MAWFGPCLIYSLLYISPCSEESLVKFRVMRSGVHLSPTDVPSVFPQLLLRKGLGLMDRVEPHKVMKEINQVVLEWVQESCC